MKLDWGDSVMALLSVFKCLDIDQLYQWMWLRLQASHGRSEGVLHRLKVTGKLVISGDYIGLLHRTPDPDMLDAFSVMLQLVGGRAENMVPGNKPVMLRFTASTDGKASTFSVLAIRSGHEVISLGRIEREYAPAHQLIIILDSPAQKALLPTLPNCFFALPCDAAPAGKRTFKFYKGEAQDSPSPDTSKQTD